MQFPSVTGSSLQRKRLSLPQAFEGERNLVFVAFQQWQQSQVDTWIPFARQLEASLPGLCYYELPTIRRLNALSRTFINEGMRAGIPDPVARERTITLYVDKNEFRRALQLPHEEEIHVLLLDRSGAVLWQAEGAFTPEKTFLGLDLAGARDLLLFLVAEPLSRDILETIAAVGEFDEKPGTGIAFQVAIEDAVGLSSQMETLTQEVEDQI